MLYEVITSNCQNNKFVPAPDPFYSQQSNIRITSYNVCYTKLLRIGKSDSNIGIPDSKLPKYRNTRQHYRKARQGKLPFIGKPDTIIGIPDSDIGKSDSKIGIPDSKSPVFQSRVHPFFCLLIRRNNFV